MASTHCNNSLDGWTKNTINLWYIENHLPTISAFQPIAQTILPIIVRYHWSEDQRYKFFNLGDGINNMKLQHIVFLRRVAKGSKPCCRWPMGIGEWQSMMKNNLQHMEIWHRSSLWDSSCVTDGLGQTGRFLGGWQVSSRLEGEYRQYSNQSRKECITADG